MFEIYVHETFDAAHFLPDHKGKCANMHGHTWRIELTIQSETLNNGMVHDFVDVKTTLKAILPDHSLLNDIMPNPTAENLAKYLYAQLKEHVPTITKVIVWESATSGAAYFES
ncbi:MAG TPA: 6-carboxytetrahydropterin synthase QueD [Anaerolineae bacterium]|jgi:6-pyruvoyltetrahydropterin/6-carboxytetrahydropterin synthase|nr:6-carboxytetrahydropterin synthase QueD [Anaerolineae bacterium]